MNIEQRDVPPTDESARELIWLDPRPDDTVRVVGIAKARGGVEFERCSSGGAYFIRRTRWITGTQKTIHETERKIQSATEQDWRDLLAGRAR